MNPRKATVLKILNGSAAHNPSRQRNDAAVRTPGKPEILTWMDLNDDERRVFQFLMDNGMLPAIHTKVDSMQICALCRTIVQRDAAAAKVQQFGQVMKHPQSGKPITQPYFQTWMQLNESVRRMMSELSLTPQGRMRHAPPAAGDLKEPTSWDEIE
jgi:P27 family predicted phage terminase small subunit